MDGTTRTRTTVDPLENYSTDELRAYVRQVSGKFPSESETKSELISMMTEAAANLEANEGSKFGFSADHYLNQLREQVFSC